MTVYAHEGPTVADAIAKGKKDAVRDIRSLEDSSVAKAVVQLEKILDELTSIEKGNKSVLKIAELQLQKLQPIRDAIKNSGPEVDMLSMIDALRNYPSSPVEVNIDLKEKELLENICRELGDLSDVIRRIESQDQRLESLEQAITKGLSEFGKSLDDKVGKGLAVVLSSSDRKIDKGLSEMQGHIAKLQGGDVPHDLDARLKAIEAALDGRQGPAGSGQGDSPGRGGRSRQHGPAWPTDHEGRAVPRRAEQAQGRPEALTHLLQMPLRPKHRAALP